MKTYKVRQCAIPPMHPLRWALISVAAIAVQSAYVEDISEADVERRKLRGIALRRMADTIPRASP